MQPYYDQDGITIYHGDCREVLPTMADNSVDLIVTDPPYGISWQSGYRKIAFDGIAGDHSTDAAITATRAALPKLKRGRHLYLFGRYDFSTLPISVSAELIWDKEILGMGDTSSSWGVQHEYIQFATNPKYSSKEVNAAEGRLAARLRRGSVLRYPRPNSAAVRHPAEKPVELLCELIESSSCRGEVVIDYFSGIGSTLVAARMEGRKAIGIEIEERYCEMAANRLSQRILSMVT